jgi:23S rRNA pseudouridine955/2504/2580 synthase/23S rRNA pseudouridine1911/1915/1917 synthase
VLLLAKTIDAQRHLSHQFQLNAVRKQYLALVVGRPESDEGEIDAPLASHPTSRLHMAVSKHGRPARTAWKVEELFAGYTLLRCFPRTGKTHQIRVHLRHIGLPLAVDPLYNRQQHGQLPGILLSSFKRGYRPARGREERPLIDRLTLHAQSLSFAHPDGRTVTAEAPLPRDMRAVLAQLRKHAGR